MWLLLILLILAPQVIHAECAWVLWTRKDQRELRIYGEWTPSTAFDTKTECVEEITKTAKLFKESDPMKVLVGPPRDVNNKITVRFVNIAEPLKAVTYNYECWPSEIKPK
jgi:hypothetical protein